MEQSSLCEVTSFLASKIPRLYGSRISTISLTRVCHFSLNLRLPTMIRVLEYSLLTFRTHEL
jgi:hypothetical protein